MRRNRDMDKEKLHFQMVTFMKANIKMERDMEKEHICSKEEKVFMKESMLIIRNMV
jgi:hypothetical protein